MVFLKIAVTDETEERKFSFRYIKSFGAAKVYSAKVRAGKRRHFKKLLRAFSEEGITCAAVSENGLLAEKLRARGMTVFTERGILAYLSGRMALLYLDGVGADISRLFFRIEGSGRYAYLCAKELSKRTGRICFSCARAEELSRKLLEETGVSATRRREGKDTVVINLSGNGFIRGEGVSASASDFSVSAFSEEIPLPLAAALAAGGFLAEKDIEIFLKK